MVKLRVEGTKEELDGFNEILHCFFEVLSESKQYPNRNSAYSRVYYDLDFSKLEKGEGNEKDQG